MESISLLRQKGREGYLINQTKYPFEIEEQGKTVILTTQNKKITGELGINKVDITDGNNKLLNAEPTVFNEHGKEDVVKLLSTC